MDKRCLSASENYRFEATYVNWPFAELPDEDECEGGGLYFILSDPNGTRTATFEGFTVMKMKPSRFGNTKFAIWPPLSVTQKAAMQTAAVVQFRVWDDDDYTVFDTPCLVDGGGILSLALSQACVVPVYADSYNIERVVPYKRHTTEWDLHLMGARNRDIGSRADCWAVRALAAYETDRYVLGFGNVKSRRVAPASDSDPDGYKNIVTAVSGLNPTGEKEVLFEKRASEVYGVSDGGVAMLFVQLLNEWPSLSPLVDSLRAEDVMGAILAHEIGHTAEIEHNEFGGLMRAEASEIVKECFYRPEDISLLRSVEVW